MKEYEIIKDLEKIQVSIKRTIAVFPLLAGFPPIKEAVVKLSNMIDYLKTRKALEK